MTNNRFQVNEGEVAAKVMDGEAIIINLSNGVYYSLNGAGGLIWSLIEGGHSPAETAEAVCVQYDILAERAKVDVQSIVEELLREGLLELANDRDPVEGVDEKPENGRMAYEPPRLIKYDDMAELFALDPPLPALPDVQDK